MRQRRKENACWRLLCCLCNSIIEAEKGERSQPRAPERITKRPSKPQQPEPERSPSRASERIIKRPSKPQQPEPSSIGPSKILHGSGPPPVDLEEDEPPTYFSANGPQEQLAQPSFSVQDVEEDMRPPVSGDEPSERTNVTMHGANGPIVSPMVPPVVQDSSADTRPATYLGNGPGAQFAGQSERKLFMVVDPVTVRFYSPL